MDQDWLAEMSLLAGWAGDFDVNRSALGQPVAGGQGRFEVLREWVPGILG